jgi:Zn-dependent peptidase ImmA (M78 family)
MINKTMKAFDKNLSIQTIIKKLHEQDLLKPISNNKLMDLVNEFKPINEKDVETVIQNLDVGENALKSRGFTYVSAEYRLIFVNEDLTDEEKLLVLSHELGHIVCEHFSVVPIIGNDVKEEYEANEFAHYVLNQSTFIKGKKLFAKNKKLVLSIITIVVLCILVFCATNIIKRKQSYYGEFYITTTGSKYHKKDCIFIKEKNNVERLTKEQFSTSEYSPCEMCLPNK